MRVNRIHTGVCSAGLGIVALALFNTASAQGEGIAAKLAERERSLKGLELSWQLEESKKLFARRDVGKPEGAGVVFDYDDQSWTHSATYDFLHTDINLVVSGEYAVFNSELKKVDKRKIVGLFTVGAAGVIQFADVMRPDNPSSAEFVSTSGFGAKSSNPLDSSGVLLPQDYLFLLGLSPEGTYGMRWQFTNDGDGNIIAEGRNYDDDERILNTNLRNHWIIRVKYDGETLCPLAGNLIQEGHPEQSYACEGQEKVSGACLPKRVIMTHRNGSDRRPMSETTRAWTLVSTTPIDEALFPIPPHTQIGDYRLDAKDMHLMLFPPKGAEPVLYLWQSRLPTLDELQRIRSGETVAMTDTSTPRWILPSALIAVGFVWLGFALRRRSVVKRSA